MNGVESRPLRYFVAVAEELNFARAAERLGIAPPALSRAISTLEAKLKVQLLERSTRKVTLTDVGAVLLAESRIALTALDAAVERARRSGLDEGPSLVVAVKADVEGGLLEDVLAAYRAECPGIPVDVVFTGWGDQPAMLRAGEADVAILIEPYDAAGLDAELLLREPQLLALPTGHPLGHKARLRMADIECQHRQSGPGAHVYVPEGEQRPRFSDVTQMLRQVELGRMLTLFPASLAGRYVRPELTWRPVEDAPDAVFVVAWAKDSRSVAVAAFVRAATTVAGRRLGAHCAQVMRDSDTATRPATERIRGCFPNRRRRPRH